MAITLEDIAESDDFKAGAFKLLGTSIPSEIKQARVVAVPVPPFILLPCVHHSRHRITFNTFVLTIKPTDLAKYNCDSEFLEGACRNLDTIYHSNFHYVS